MKPFLDVLSGSARAVPPIWIMRQAGRYLPEYRAIRAKARDFVDFCLTPDLAIEATLQPIRRYGLDAAILFADILLLPQAMGQSLAFVEGEGPKLDPIRDREGLKRLTVAGAAERLAPVMETVKGVRAALPGDVALIGFAGAPWTVATYMVEGGGGSDFATIRRMAWAEPKLFGDLLDALTEATAAYLIAQIDAGAEALQLFDTWAGSVPAPLFERAVIQPAAAIVRAVKAHKPGIPVIGFPRGAAAYLTSYAQKTGVDGVGIDHMTPLAFAAAQVPAKTALQGNLDPILLLAGGESLADEARRLVRAMAGRPYIFNLGHGVLPPTPPEHVAELIAAVRGA
ncbi:MAG: uroporphyrinogen decarboxylase [Micropepsaceae bacterium]